MKKWMFAVLLAAGLALTVVSVARADCCLIEDPFGGCLVPCPER